jgi:antitoxin HicB
MFVGELAMNEVLIPLTIEALEEGGYLATSPIWDELLAQGRTIAEALEIAQDVARKLLESYIEHGDPLPAAIAQALKHPAQLMNIPIAVPVAI